MNERVSIILPVYNAEHYVDRILSELCKQTYVNLEIIVINDGSIDGTGMSCEKWAAKDARVRYKAQENQGVGAVRNHGLQLASADYVMFVDADDEIEPEFIEDLLEPIIVSGADMSVADIDNIYLDTRRHALSQIRLPYGITDVSADLNVISKVRTFCWGKLYKKRLWLEHGIYFPEGETYRKLPGFEDICCLPLLAAHAKKIAHVKTKPYHYYRGHEGSLMDRAKFEFFRNSQIETLRRFQDAGLMERFRPALRKFVLGQLVSANRWNLEPEDRLSMWSLIAEYFPELGGLEEYQVYAPPGSVYDVLKHVFFDRIKFTERKGENVLEFSLPEMMNRNEEDENLCYDLADGVIDGLPETLVLRRNKK